MPRITAKTVKEHRENVQTALVDVTEEILRNEPGTDPVSYTHLRAHET